MRFFLALALFASLAAADYEIRTYSTRESFQISSSGSYTLYGSAAIAGPGVSSGAGYTLDSGFLHSEAGCIVKFNDLESFAMAWLFAGSSSADLNWDFSVDASDFAILARYWLCDCPPGWSLK